MTLMKNKEGHMVWRAIVEHIWWVVGGMVIGANAGFILAALLSAAHENDYPIRLEG